MNNIEGIQPPNGPHAIDGVSPAGRGVRIQTSHEIADVVEMSSAARLAARVQDLPEIRTDLVERVKAEIAAGEYETPERIEATVDRLMDELFPLG